MSDPTQLTRRDREVIAAAYEVDAARARSIPVRNPIAWIFLHAVAKFLEERAKDIRKGVDNFGDDCGAEERGVQGHVTPRTPTPRNRSNDD